jgi:transcriptional regulator with AAA-type ATPase domain
MSKLIRLAVEDRAFLEGVRRCAFMNPFGSERQEADRKVAGLEAGEWGEALRQLLAELARRLAAFAGPGGAVDRRAYVAEDAVLVSTGILFSVFHANMARFDGLIQRQMASGDASCEAPFTGEVFETLLRHGFTTAEAEQDVAFFYQLRRAFYFISENLSGGSPCMMQLRKRLWDNIFTHDIRWYERGLWSRMEDFSTLLLGETGTGKGAAAFALGRSGFIPFLSARRLFAESFTRAFVPINLSQYPETLIESELFGHRKGAFTGAVEKHDGVFSRCSPHGAIFLDEIGDVAETVQIKLLQVLQQRVFSPVGSHEARRFEGRVIAATNRNLGELRREGRFRDDFFYRLCSDQIEVPPLRQRRDDIPLLAEHFLIIFAQREGQERKKMLPETVEILKGYDWPGNARELRNIIERLVIMTPGKVITPEQIPDSIAGAPHGREGHGSLQEPNSLREAREEFEREFIIQKLEENDWNISRTADAIELERSNLYRKMKSYGIDAKK